MAWIAPVISAVGMGVQYSAAQQQASAQSRLAEYNYAIESQNAAMQRSLSMQQASYQSQLAKAQAEHQAATYRAEAQYAAKAATYTAEQQARVIESSKIIAEQNAQALRDASTSRLATARENATRISDEARAFQGTQIAQLGKAGLVSSSGSPLEMLADAAAMFEMEKADLYRAMEMENRQGEQAAAIEDYKARGYQYEADVARAQGGLNAHTALFEASLASKTALLEGELASSQAGMEGILGSIAASSAQRQAELSRMIGLGTASSTKSMAGATLLSSAGQLFGQMSSNPFWSGKNGMYKYMPSTSLSSSQYLSQKPFSLSY